MFSLIKNVARLTVPNDLGYLSVITEFVASMASKHGFDNIEVTKIEIALEEAVANVIMHAFTPDENATFDVICRALPVGIEIVVADQGMPFDPSALKPYNPLDLNVTGIGSHLMKNLMDNVVYENMGNKGKATHLYKYFSGQDLRTDPSRVGDVFTMSQEPQSKLQGKIQKLKLRTRRIKDEEAIEIARLAYHVYGYTYIADHIYYPERIISMNKTDQMISCVGVMDDDTVASYVAVISYDDFPGVVEMAAAMTRPEMRGRKALNQIVDFAIKESLRLGKTTIFAQATTAHIHSQPILKKLGFNVWGFMLAYTSPMLLKKIDSAVQDRHSVLVAGRFYAQTKPINVFIPSRHRDIILSVYEKIGVAVNEIETGEIPQKSVVSTSVNTTLGMGKIVVKCVGEDIITILKQETTKIKRMHLVLCDLYINMSQAGCKVLFDKIEQTGFFFTGILPGSDAGDFIVMQFFNGIDVNFDLIKIYDGFGREMLDYLREDYAQRFVTDGEKI